MEIILNGDKLDVPDRATIEALVKKLGLQDDRVAVECNRVVISRTAWPGIFLKENDQVEIIQFVGGGTI